MKVYVVSYGYDGELLGVFSTRQLAHDRINSYSMPGLCWITVCEVDVPCVV